MVDKLSQFRPGDQIKVISKIKDDSKSRTQVFAGVLLAVSGSQTNKTFTVRRLTSDKVSVERIFPVGSPAIERIELVKKGKARRAKLYYLRKRGSAKI